VKKILIFAAGAVAGTGVGFLIGKIFYEKKMEAEVDKQVEATKEWLEKQYKEQWSADVETIVDQVVNETESTEVSREDGRPMPYTDRMNRRKEELMKRERVRYDTMPDHDSEDGEEVKESDEDVDELRMKINDDNPADDIYVITPEQFALEKHSFDKVTLFWWELERILTEEDLDILDVPEILGYGWEAHIGEFEVGMVYVRNEKMETDYEVIVKHDSFYEMRG